MNADRYPYRSETRPMKGMPAVYPIRYAVIAHDAVSSCAAPTRSEFITSGRIVTMTVWSPAATNMPAHKGSNDQYRRAMKGGLFILDWRRDLEILVVSGKFDQTFCRFRIAVLEDSADPGFQQVERFRIEHQLHIDDRVSHHANKWLERA